MVDLPDDSLVLVTGANGFIASHVVDAFLAKGYRVRGSTRSASKLAPLQEFWGAKYGPGRFQIAVVEDMAIKGAYEEALKDVAGVIHVAASFPSTAAESLANPALTIDPMVNGTRYILQSAAAQPTVKSFVLTSSSFAAIFREMNTVYDLDENSWNHESVEKAYSLPMSDPLKFMHIYAAGKTLAEQAAWKFYNEEKPGFIMNSVIPNFTIGPPVGPERPRSSSLMVSTAVGGDMSGLKTLRPLKAEWFVDVRDAASLHVHALISPQLSSGGIRIWAVSAPFNGNDILHVLRELHPDKNFPADFEGLPRDLSRIDNRRGSELLGGMRDLKQAIQANTSHINFI
ncbi:hypothetical protein HWV62_2932 [Athelia sp. TMB]|nr:hypothetical protein HWV62_2932 [Athelia sp. TMB]